MRRNSGSLVWILFQWRAISRRDLALDREQRIVAVRADQHVEDIADAR